MGLGKVQALAGNLVYVSVYNQGMASEIVQFREDPEALAFLRERGINPNEFAREAFESMLARLKMREKAEALGKLNVRLPEPIEDIIRRDRESH